VVSRVANRQDNRVLNLQINLLGSHHNPLGSQATSLQVSHLINQVVNRVSVLRVNQLLLFIWIIPRIYGALWLLKMMSRPLLL
jgi:hypothetical protein